MTNSSATTADCHSPSNRWTSPRTLAGLLLIALVVRLIVVIAASADLQSDPDGYVGLAASLAEDGRFSSPGSHRPTAFRPPLLPLLVSGGVRLGLTPAWTVAAINIFAGLVTVLVTWLLARAAGLNEPWLTAATAVTVFDPLLLRYTALPMTEVCSAALLTVGVWLMMRFQQSNAEKVAAAAGICLGLGALCRPIIFITAMLLVVCCGVMRLRRAQSVQRVLSAIAIPTAALLVTMAPWVIRNVVQFDAFIPATTHGGYTLLLGNNPVFYREVVEAAGQPVWGGDSLRDWQQDTNQRMLNTGVEAGDEPSADRWMYEQARFEMQSHPMLFAKACLLRWKRFWSLTSAENSTWSAKEAVRSETPAFPMDVVAPTAVSLWYGVLWIGLLGALVLPEARRQTRCWQLLWVAILSFLLMHTFYWTNTRMRAPLTGVFAVLAAAGWRGWWNLLRSARGPTQCDS